MADVLTREQRHLNMSRIRSRDTGIEVKVRKELFKRGFRFRKNVRSLPGTPDIVLAKYRTVVFVHGCYWHRHSGCQYATIPSTRREFWEKKFEDNVRRDQECINELISLGWQVIVLWECELNKKQFEMTINEMITKLKNR